MTLTELIKLAQGDRSQNEFALHTGISSAAITKILQGERKPSPDTLRKIAGRAYGGVTYEMLMHACGYTDEVPPPVSVEGLDPIGDAAFFRMAARAKNEGIPPEDVDLLIDYLKKARKRDDDIKREGKPNT